MARVKVLSEARRLRIVAAKCPFYHPHTGEGMRHTFLLSKLQELKDSWSINENSLIIWMWRITPLDFHCDMIIAFIRWMFTSTRDELLTLLMKDNNASNDETKINETERHRIQWLLQVIRRMHTSCLKIHILKFPWTQYYNAASSRGIFAMLQACLPVQEWVAQQGQEEVKKLKDTPWLKAWKEQNKV